MRLCIHIYIYILMMIMIIIMITNNLIIRLGLIVSKGCHERNVFSQTPVGVRRRAGRMQQGVATLV